MVTLLVLLALLFSAFGLGTLGCVFAASVALSIHVFAPDLAFPGNLVVGLLVALVPITSGLAVMLVERLSEVRSSIKSLRALVVLLSMVLLFEGADWMQHLSALLMALRGAELGYVSALLVSALGAVLFCSAATALAVTLGQFVCQWVVMLGARMGKVEFLVPWRAMRLLGALLVAGASLQLFEALYAHEFAPRSLVAAVKEGALGK